MANTVETVWKLILDEKSADDSEEAIERLARDAGKLGEELNKIARSKQLEQMAQSWGKTAVETGRAVEAAEALNAELVKMGASEDELKSLAKTFSDVGKAKDGGGGSGGKGAPAAAKFRGIAGMVGGSGLADIVGIVDDLQDASEGLSALGAAAGIAGPASTAAAPGLFATAAGLGAMLLPLLPLIAAIGAVVAVLAILKQADDQRAADLKKQAELERAISDEIAAGATYEDIQKQIQQLQFRAKLEADTLERNKQKYDEYIESVRNAAGGLGRLLEPFIRLFGGEEQQLADNITESEKLIGDLTEKSDLYNSALERGDTAVNDAKKREEELADAREKAAEETERATEKAQREKEQADAKAKAEQEKAAAEVQRAAEQRAAKEEQIEQKRLDAGRKYSDSLIDIARKTADDAGKALQSLKDTTAENTRAFQQDISDIGSEFQDSEREEAIKRGEEEVNDLIQYQRKLEGIRDEAFRNEADLLKKRDFLGATRVREAANEQMAAEGRALKDAQDDRERARKSEDAQQLRELDKARRDRLQALERSNAEAKLGYQKALRDQKAAQKIADREAGIARDRSLREAMEQARALLGIQRQSGAAQLELAQQTLNGVRNMTTNNTTVNNNQRSVGTLNINTHLSGAGISGTTIENSTLRTLGAVGLA